MTIPRALAALAALLAASACTLPPPAGAPSPDALLSDAPTRSTGGACRVSAHPQALPSADALVDSAGLAAAVADAWRAAGRPPGHVLLALRYDRAGVNVRRDVIEHRVGGALADSLQKLAFAHRRGLAAGEHEWGVRLRVDLADEPRMRVGRTEVCSARPRTGESAWAATTFVGSWPDAREAFSPPAAAELPSASTVWVRVALDSRGHVTDARVERSLGRLGGENRLLNYVRSIAFIPAMEDGYPVPAQLSVPVRMDR